MKKILLISAAIILGLLAFIIIFYFRPAGTGKTAQDAVSKSGRTITRVIKEEKVKDGEVLFFLKNSHDVREANLAAGFIKKTFWGWKWIYGGEHGTISSMCTYNGFSSQYLPNVENTPFPMFFGAITDTKINHIKILEVERNIYKDTELIKDGNVIIWYAFLDNFKGKKFNILAYSEDGKEYKVEETDISPYSADQKPLVQSSAEEFIDQLKK